MPNYMHVACQFVCDDVASQSRAPDKPTDRVCSTEMTERGTDSGLKQLAAEEVAEREFGRRDQ